jgi:hypothetical protein
MVFKNGMYAGWDVRKIFIYILSLYVSKSSWCEYNLMGITKLRKPGKWTSCSLGNSFPYHYIK